MKKFKDNNKGFSLVELIVVIAIMVVLIAVLGSTILGYVEKSKYSKDIQALDSLKTAVSTYVADGNGNYVDGTTYTLTALLGTTTVGTGESATTVAMDPNGVIKKTLGEVFKFTTDTSGAVTGATFEGSSKAFKGISSSNVHIKIVDGAVSIYVPVNSGYASDYDAYEVGEGASIVTPSSGSGSSGS